jgi:hypothetical protein
MKKLLVVLTALLITLMGVLVVDLTWGGDVNASGDTAPAQVKQVKQTR